MKRRTWTKLDQPLRARKPATWVMPDVFAPGWTDEKRDEWFAMVGFCTQHQFELDTQHLPAAIAYWKNPTLRLGVLPNLSIWSTIRDQADADRDLPLLLSCPAAVRGLRVVATEEVDIRHIHADTVEIDALTGDHGVFRPLRGRSTSRIHRVRITGDTSRNAAPCNVECLRSIAHQCEAAGLRPGVDVVVEAMGRKVYDHKPFRFSEDTRWPSEVKQARSSRDCSEITLTSRTGSDPAEWPADLRRFAEKENGNA